MFAHTNATLQGLSTIRAFKAEKILCNEFGTRLDLFSTSSFLFNASSRAFAVWVELTCCVYIGVALIYYLTVGHGNVLKQFLKTY